MDVDLLKEAVIKCDAGEELVLVTIIKSVGSTPRGVGAQMIVEHTGAISGTVGGGLVEEKARQTAMIMIKNNISFQKLKFDLDANTQAQEGMICGGKQELILELLGNEGR